MHYYRLCTNGTIIRIDTTEKLSLADIEINKLNLEYVGEPIFHIVGDKGLVLIVHPINNEPPVNPNYYNHALRKYFPGITWGHDMVLIKIDEDDDDLMTERDWNVDELNDYIELINGDTSIFVEKSEM